MRSGLLLGLTGLACAAVAAAQAPVTPLGPQFQLNEVEACSLGVPHPAAFADDELWIWSEGGPFGDPDSPRLLRSARFGLDGTPLPVPFPVQGDSQDVSLHRIDQDPAGNLWLASLSSSGSSIRVRSLGRLDEPRPEEAMSVGGVTSLDVAAAPGGHALLVWTETQLDANRLLYRLFGPDGEPVHEVQVLASIDPDAGRFPAVRAAALTAETFALVWLDDRAGPSRLMTRLLVNQGTVAEPVFTAGPAVRIDHSLSGAESEPEVAATAGGGFAVGWVGWAFPAPAEVFVRRLDATGTAGAPMTVATGDGIKPEFVGLAASPDGRLAITWQELSLNEAETFFEWSLRAALLDAQGGLLGEPFRVSAPTEFEIFRSSLTFTPAGDLLVGWEEGISHIPVLPPPCIVGSHFAFGRRFDTGCTPGALCLQDDRFEVTVTWEDPFNGGTGVGHPRQLTGDTGSFWFFSENNLELMVKVLDGRTINDHWWVFFGSLTNVGFELTVVDRATGAEKTYPNPPFTFASRGDTLAFEED